MTTPDAPQSFDEAAERFSDFLSKNGYPARVVWVEQDDIVWDKHQLWIREHAAAGECARRRYSQGIEAGFGIALHAFSVAEGVTIAAVVLPVDDDAAQRYLVPYRGLKLSAALKPRRARRVSSRLFWFVLSLLHREPTRSFAGEYLECT